MWVYFLLILLVPWCIHRPHKKIVPCFMYQFCGTISLWATFTYNVLRQSCVIFRPACNEMQCIRVSHKIDVCLNCATWQKYLLNNYARGIRAVGFVLQPVSQFIFLFPVHKIQSMLQYDGFAVFPLWYKCPPRPVGCFLLLFRMIQVSLFLIIRSWGFLMSFWLMTIAVYLLCVVHWSVSILWCCLRPCL
jgi:hypothetical protein